MDVSDPASPNYGNHWTPTEVMDMFAPAEESVKEVLEWLMDAGHHGPKVKYAKHQGVSFAVFPEIAHYFRFRCVSIHVADALIYSFRFLWCCGMIDCDRRHDSR